MENNLYNEIVKTTAAMASVSETSIPSSKGYLKRWTNLSDFWTSKPEIFDDIFYKAIAHIATGRYPDNSRTLKPLLALIEKAILTDSSVLCAWRRNKVFSYAFKRVTDVLRYRRHHSSIIYQFSTDRLYSLTFYRDEFCRPVDLATDSYLEIKRATSIACVRRRFENFTEIIHVLIPDAQNWNAHQWTSEKHIFAAIKSVHGIDYTKDADAFDRIISMMKHKLNSQPYYYELFRIKHLPSSMAEAIWPENIIKELSKQLLIASNVNPIITNGSYRPDIDSVAPSVVNTSWAYQILVSHIKSRELSKAVTDNLMYFGWGEHPHIIRGKQRAAAAAALKSA